MLLIGQAGFEPLLAREVAELHGRQVAATGAGWARVDPAEPARDHALCAQLAFAHRTLLQPVEIAGTSVNGLAQQLTDFFLGSLRGERVAAAWPNAWTFPAEIVGLGRRAGAVEGAFQDLLKRKLSRVAKLATAEVPRTIGPARGLFVHFVDFGRCHVAREAWLHGPRRMADDALAPSRSYLKVEESYGLLGREPAAGETICDLGAAPGGWSYSGAKRGARVIAVDNGPLKGGALDHPQIEHRREDAFRFVPPRGERFDWLFCDLVEEPHHVLEDLVRPWLTQRWSRRFVVNLKFGRVDAVKLLAELRRSDSPFVQQAGTFRVAHLYHDREEFTVVGEVSAPASLTEGSVLPVDLV
jgi:23S rRNA (cytidine2498-2'-O)-methyltransferase